MKLLLAGGAVGIAAALSTACVVVDSQGHIAREERKFQVKGTPELHLTTYDGAIEIHAGDVGAVTVEIERRGPSQQALDELVVDSKQDGNRIDVEEKKPAHDYIFFGIGHMTPSARLIVTMPAQGDVTARSGDGAIRISHVKGRLDLHTGDGSIRGSDISGTLSFSSGDGSVTLDHADGDLTVETGDGGVSLTGVLARLRLRTGDGSVTLRVTPASAMTDDWSIVTGDGGVALYLPPDFDADLDAHSGDGSIRNELSLDSVRESGRHAVRGRLGSGGRTLTVRTGDGSIRLSQQ